MYLKDFIVTTELENNDKSDIYGKPIMTTKDDVFLRSSNEVSNTPKQNQAIPTDYAVACGVAMEQVDSFLNRKTCPTWLRDRYNANDVFYIEPSGFAWSTGVMSKCIGIRPSLRLSVDAVLDAQRKNVNLLGTIKRVSSAFEDYFTMEFGEFPKTYVGDSLDNALCYELDFNRLQSTGKFYSGFVDAEFDRPTLNEEFVYSGKKYVYAVVNEFNEKSVYSNNKQPQDNYNWFRVEPIVWTIKNWNDLPSQINPTGNGSAKFIELETEQAILSGIPFYAYDFDENDNASYWQNSMIRAYLNGYNIHASLDNSKVYGGNKRLKAPQNYDFTVQNFLNQAFVISEVKMVNTQSKAEPIKPKRNSYGIEVATGKMSVGKQIEFYINNGQPFMLHGKSGIGKTRRVQDVDPNLTSIILRNGILPEEVIGKTIYPNNSTTTGGVWVPPAWYVDLCKKCEKEPDKKHVLFVDELTNVDEHEQSLVFHIILNNSIGPNFGVLPKNAVVVAAGNSKEESESAYNMTEPLFRRFNAHVYLEPDIKEWLEWANQINPAKNRPNVHPLVSSFVAANKDEVFFTDYDSEEPPKQAIDPRGWEQVSDILYNCNGSVARELIYNKVGKEIGESFVAHLINPPLSVQDVVDGNYTKDDIPHMFDTQYALALSLQYATEGQIAKVRQFVGNHLGSEMLSIFDTVWVGNDDERAILIDSLAKQENQKAEQDKRREQQEQEEVLELQK